MCSIEILLKKVEQTCLTVVWQMTSQKSHICWYHVHSVDTMFCFVSSVCFGLFENFIWSGIARDWLSLKKSTVHINSLEYFFLEIDLCLSLSLLTLSLSDILATHDSNTDSHA